MSQKSLDQVGVYLEIASAILALVVVIYHLVRDHKTKTDTPGMTVLARAAGLAILPQGILIMVATSDPSLLCTIPGLRLFFMLSGLSLFYVSLKSVTS